MNIYLDMDGVLTDFWARFKSLEGEENTELIAKVGYSEYLKCLETHGTKFWSEMGWTDDGKELWEYLSTNNYPITIISRPVDIPSCIPGKTEWCIKELGKKTEECIFDVDKYKYCKNSTDLLIDDSSENITSWREAGGQAIMHTSASSTIAILEGIKAALTTLYAPKTYSFAPKDPNFVSIVYTEPETKTELKEEIEVEITEEVKEAISL